MTKPGWKWCAVLTLAVLLPTAARAERDVRDWFICGDRTQLWLTSFDQVGDLQRASFFLRLPGDPSFVGLPRRPGRPMACTRVNGQLDVIYQGGDQAGTHERLTDLPDQWNVRARIDPIYRVLAAVAGPAETLSRSPTRQRLYLLAATDNPDGPGESLVVLVDKVNRWQIIPTQVEHRVPNETALVAAADGLQLLVQLPGQAVTMRHWDGAAWSPPQPTPLQPPQVLLTALALEQRWLLISGESMPGRSKQYRRLHAWAFDGDRWQPVGRLDLGEEGINRGRLALAPFLNYIMVARGPARELKEPMDLKQMRITPWVTGGDRAADFQPLSYSSFAQRQARQNSWQSWLLPLLLVALVFVMISRRPAGARTPAPTVAKTGTVAPAPLWRRAIALLIDLVAAALIALAIYATLWLGELEQFYQEFKIPNGQFIVPKRWGGVSLTTLFVYLTLFELLWAATPGKRLASLRVVNITGEPAQPWQIIVRNLIKLFEVSLLALPLVLMLLSPLRQRLGDLLGRTVVVRPTKTDDV